MNFCRTSLIFMHHVLKNMLMESVWDTLQRVQKRTAPGWFPGQLISRNV
jgi:hypothetical protein